MSNTAYYQAETRLIARINNMSHDRLADKLELFVRNAAPDTNRELFAIFDITEEVEDDA